LAHPGGPFRRRRPPRPAAARRDRAGPTASRRTPLYGLPAAAASNSAAGRPAPLCPTRRPCWWALDGKPLAGDLAEWTARATDGSRAAARGRSVPSFRAPAREDPAFASPRRGASTDAGSDGRATPKHRNGTRHTSDKGRTATCVRQRVQRSEGLPAPRFPIRICFARAPHSPRPASHTCRFFFAPRSRSASGPSPAWIVPPLGRHHVPRSSGPKCAQRSRPTRSMTSRSSSFASHSSGMPPCPPSRG
jgi:hypothetical protein